MLTISKVKFITLTVLVAITLLASSLPMVHAQEEFTKKMKKQYKKQLKKTSVEQYAQLKNNIKTKKSNIEKIKQEINAIESTEGKGPKKVMALKNELNMTREQIAYLRKEIANMTDPGQMEKVEQEVSTETQKTDNKKIRKATVNGIIFRVQIGAFKNQELTKFFEKNDEFLSSGNTIVDIDSYTVGSFSDYWEADAFKKLMRKMGASNVRVVVYKDGTRTSMKEVLERLRATN